MAARPARTEPPIRPISEQGRLAGQGRPTLTLVLGGRVGAPAPFVVAPPALLRLDRIVTPEEIDMLRCRRLHPAAGGARGAAR